MTESRAEEFFKCDCEHDGILVRKEDWGNGAVTEIILEFWDRHPHGRFPLLWRIKRAWWQLLGSHRLDPLYDMHLHPEEAKRLAHHLLKLSEKEE